MNDSTYDTLRRRDSTPAVTPAMDLLEVLPGVAESALSHCGVSRVNRLKNLGVPMPLTVDQAKAFFSACIGSPKVKANLEGALGHGHVPPIDLLDSSDSDTLDKLEQLALQVHECAEVLIACVRDRPRQGELELDGEGKTKKGRRKATA